MSRTLRGRPPLNIPPSQIFEAVRRRRNVMAAARELGCSDSYIHVKFKEAGLTLAEVASTLEELLKRFAAAQSEQVKRSTISVPSLPITGIITGIHYGPIIDLLID